MDGCGLSSLDPGLGKSLPQLRVLSLCDNEIADTAGLKAIASFKKLEELYVADNVRFDRKSKVPKRAHGL